MRDITKVMNRSLDIDPIGLAIADAVEFMTLEQAKPYLKEEAYKKYKSGEEEWTYEEYTPENVLNKIKDYLEFAWEKANNARGISAGRSMLHLSNWFYMFGNEECDKLAEELLSYEYYGKPWLAVISELVGVDWEQYDDNWWSNCDMECDGISGDKRYVVIDNYKSKIEFDKIKEFLNKIQEE